MCVRGGERGLGLGNRVRKQEEMVTACLRFGVKLGGRSSHSVLLRTVTHQGDHTCSASTFSLPHSGIELCLPGWRFSMTMVASFLMVAGQLLMPGVAALCRNWPDWDDWQVLQMVILSPFVLMLPYIW